MPYASVFLSLLAWRGLTSVAASSLPGVGSTHTYSGQPSGDYSPAWQSYFEVSASLPNISFSLPGKQYAGNVAVQRPNHPNDTLFFWGFEKTQGSLGAGAGQNSDAPWAVWLNGGPGESSMEGLFVENGPFRVQLDSSMQNNNWSWNNLMDYFWVDQPVGVGLSTVDDNGFVADEDQIGTDFMGFLDNLVKVFPSLASRPFYLTGESYAGRYISYIAKTYFGTSNPPVKLAGIVLGDPAIGSNDAFKTLPTISLVETYPQLIGYDTAVYDYFKEQASLCQLDLQLQYPGSGKYPSIDLDQGNPRRTGRPVQDDSLAAKKKADRKANPHKSTKNERELLHELKRRKAEVGGVTDRRRKHAQFKRDLTGRPNGTIDPWYGCDIWDELLDYAVNFTFPWTGAGEVDQLTTWDATNDGSAGNAGPFLSDHNVLTAIHAPLDKDWNRQIDYSWDSLSHGGDPSVEPMAFFDDLAANMSKAGVTMHIYVGNDDTLSGHFGTQISIQNTSFGGTQGFTRQPNTPWSDDLGDFAGVIHQERNWTFAIVTGAGHRGPYYRPAALYRFVRDFVLGSDNTGLVTDPSQPAQGGENSALGQQQGIIPGQATISYGTATAPAGTAWPTATVLAFQSHVGISFSSGAIPTSTAPAKKKHSGAGLAASVLARTSASVAALSGVLTFAIMVGRL